MLAVSAFICAALIQMWIRHGNAAEALGAGGAAFPSRLLASSPILPHSHAKLAGPAPRQEIKPAVREKAHAQGMSGKPALMTNAAFLR